MEQSGVDHFHWISLSEIHLGRQSVLFWGAIEENGKFNITMEDYVCKHYK